VDLDTDRRHCGDCATTCGSGEVCVDGACALSCPTGLTDCGGVCVDTESDPAHCGGCAGAGGAVCASPAHGTGVCAAGACAVVCDAGYLAVGGACLFFPVTCAHVRAADPTAADGNYTLHVGGNPARPWTAWCYDMAGTPREFLTLVLTGGDYNFGQYTASSGTNVRTNYTRIRLDPATLLVHCGDQTFAASTGTATQGSITIRAMPYAVAADCAAPNSATGLANINLTGTPFRVNDTFCRGGYLAGGAATISADGKTASITGGGYCGWNVPCPGGYEPYNSNVGAVLNLAYVD
jgi:hypothetical protein